MQALILAAGMGRRLGAETEDKTKGMVKVLGKTLLERSLDILTSFDEIKRIVLVIGYAGQGVKNCIGNSYNGRPVIYIENPDYDKTNNIYSLFLARREFEKEDTLLLESDLIFERALIERLMNNHKNKDLVLVAPWESWMDGTVATLTEDREIIQFIFKENFDYNKIGQYYKTVNIYKFSREFISNIYTPFLDAYCRAFGHSEYYENILAILAFHKRAHLKAEVLENGEKWYEIDDLNDLDIAETLFSNDATSYLQRYGGFWRFPRLKDFCYLVNPYFPTKKMLLEFQVAAPRLLTEYPSTSKVQRKLAANMFGCNKENIAVGNGASEIISALMSCLTYEKIGVPIPTFHEYIARALSDRVVYFRPQKDNFTYTLSDLIEFSSNIDTMILVNPDNPSGNYIPKSDLLDLVQYFESKGKTIVIDESFVDFCEQGFSQTLIDDDILLRYKRLVVIKSIGKSFGVPGSRLGVAASGNEDLLKDLSSRLAVWNISSFGEYFLQIFSRHRRDYERSVELIKQQRNILFEALSNIEFLRPIPSSANYILCEVLSPLTCKEIRQLAIERDFLIKDCSDKLGFEGRHYIRVTVRDHSANQDFIAFLNSIRK